MQLRLSDIRAFPVVAITLVLAVVLLLFGVYLIIPSNWLGLALSTAYPDVIGRSIFGLLTSAPAVPIIYCNIKYDLKTLIKDKYKKLRPYVFWMGVTWLYLCVLRIVVAGWFPPIFLIYLALALVSFIIWFSNKYM